MSVSRIITQKNNVLSKNLKIGYMLVSNDPKKVYNLKIGYTLVLDDQKKVYLHGVTVWNIIKTGKISLCRCYVCAQLYVAIIGVFGQIIHTVSVEKHISKNSTRFLVCKLSKNAFLCIFFVKRKLFPII